METNIIEEKIIQTEKIVYTAVTHTTGGEMVAHRGALMATLM